MKPGAPSLQSTRLLDHVRERIRYIHYSFKIDKAYLYWICFFIRWSAAQGGSMRHPREMGVVDVEAFLSMLANERKVSASTHNQSLSALLFLYRDVLGISYFASVQQQLNPTLRGWPVELQCCHGRATRCPRAAKPSGRAIALFRAALAKMAKKEARHASHRH